MRLALDKATIIIKDNHTNYTFDTSVIEHLEYPRDLRFNKIVEFKDKLRAKLIATHKRSQSDPNFSTFLKSFGEYKVAHLEHKEISSEAFILESLEEIKREMRLMRRTTPEVSRPEKDLSCMENHIEEYAFKNQVFSVFALRKRKNDLLKSIYSTGHTPDEEPALSFAIDEILAGPQIRRSLNTLKTRVLKNGNK